MAKKKQTAPTDLVTVVALVNLNEDNTYRKKGEQFELSATRAAVLPELVSIVEDESAAETPAE